MSWRRAFSRGCSGCCNHEPDLVDDRQTAVIDPLEIRKVLGQNFAKGEGEIAGQWIRFLVADRVMQALNL